MPSLAIPAALIFLLSAPAAPAAPADPGLNPFRATKSADLRSITVSLGADTLCLVRVGGRWLTDKDRYPADPYRVQDFIDRLLALEARIETATVDSISLSRFGLAADERRTVAWKGAGGRPILVWLGKQVEYDFRIDLPEGHRHDESCSGRHGGGTLPPDSTFWMFPGGSQVFRSPGNLTGQHMQEDHWKDRNVFPYFVYMDVKAIEVEWRDSAGTRHQYRVDRVNDTSARLSKPRRAELPRSSAATLFAQTSQFSVDELLVPGMAPADAGWQEPPDFRIAIMLNDGRRLALRAGPAVGNHHLALHPDDGRPIKISSWRLDPYRKTPEELVHPFPARKSNGFQ